MPPGAHGRHGGSSIRPQRSSSPLFPVILEIRISPGRDREAEIALPPGPAPRWTDAWLGLGLAAFALLLRLVFLLHAGDRAWPHSTYFEGDAPLFADWAAALDRGTPFEAGLPLHSPATAYLLHWFGPPVTDDAGRPILRDFTGMKIAWCAVSAATSGLLFLAARPLGRRTAILASVLHAASFGTSVLATSLNNECLYGLVLVAVVGATARWMKRPGVGGALALGVLHGAATLLRAEHPLLVLLLAGGMVFAAGSRRRRTWAALAAMGIGLLGVCAPWMLKSRAAIVAFNTREAPPVDFSASTVRWSDDARAFLATLPGFARADNFQFISISFARQGRREVSAEDVQRFLVDEFGYIPQPISPWGLISCQGPLAFALANHADAAGGFSKAALDARFGPDPRLQFSLPTHLRLVNEGYAVGWQEIRRDPAAWLRLVLRKLERFGRGAGLGFSAANWPLGREGPRPAVDMLAPPLDTTIAWSVALGICFIAGLAVAARRRVAGLWVLVVAYKLCVTIAFFGYARQAASISPALFVLLALAVDPALAWLSRRRAWRLIGWSVLAAALTSLSVFDTWTARAPAEMLVDGPARPAPRWAPNAFEAAGTIELRLARPVGE